MQVENGLQPAIYRAALRAGVVKVLTNIASIDAGGIDCLVTSDADQGCKPRQEDRIGRSCIQFATMDKTKGRAPHDMDFLYVPVSDLGKEQQLPLAQIRSVHELLGKIMSRTFFDGAPASYFVYYDKFDGMNAFNRKRNEVWFNAASDCRSSDIGDRVYFWYIHVCHELAHYFENDHNSKFGNTLGELTLEYAKQFEKVKKGLIKKG